MKATIDKKQITITLPIEEATSASGKSITVATTRGFVDTGLQHKGKPVRVSVNAIISNK